MERSPGKPPPGVSPRFWALLGVGRAADRQVVDVGTGTGRIALGLAAYARAVVGIDRDAAAIEEARRRAAVARAANVEFLVLDAEAVDHYRGLAGTGAGPELVVAHLCVSDRIIEASARSLDRGGVLAVVAIHIDQWCETGRRSRFAYDENQARVALERRGFAVEHLEVEREVQRFESVEAALAAAIGLQERWKADGRWFRYVRFLEEGGRTLTQSHLIVRATKT